MHLPSSENIILKRKYENFRKIILCVGAQIYRKGFDIAVEVCNILNNEYDDIAFIWLGPEKNFILHEGRIKPIKDIIPSNFFLEPPTSQVEDFYNIADITLFPSRREGFGNVIIESMACETPVISSLLNGITDNIIENGIDGILISGGDAFHFYLGIKQLLTDEALYTRIKYAGLKKVEREFKTDVVMNKYYETYLSCITE
jgi:glycosyltransferase involved in cell wall biosynthesis